MHHTILDFTRKVVDAWNVKESANDGMIVFTYWENCVTGKAATFWNAVVLEHHKDDKPKAYASWMVCVGLYLEKMQNMSFIGDAACDKILQ